MDEPQEIAQRLYEDEFKLSPNDPLSMQFTLNHAGVEKRARGEMYDAFRLGIEKNDQGNEPDYDIVLQSKRQKGYNYKVVFCQKEKMKIVLIFILKIKNP